MRQRGRIGRLRREMTHYEPRPDRQASVHHLAPVPAHLAEAETKVWRDVVAKYDLDVIGYLLLENGLRMRQIARTAQKIVAAEGMMIVGRGGYPRAHPMVRIENTARQLFRQTLKMLHVQLSFTDDD